MDSPEWSSGAAPIPARAGWSLLLLLAVLVYFGALFHGLLFTTDGVFERDGFFHARYCQLLPERGLSRDFPWMQHTSWKENFCDKDFLYHAALAPFCRDATEPLTGAKWATLLLALLVLVTLYAVLRKFAVPWPVLFVLVLATGSALFVNRLLMIRSHVVSVALMLLGTYFILQRRVWASAILAFVYAWTYSFPAAMLITAGAAELGLLLQARKFHAPKIALAVGAGVLAGLIIHPYSPETFRLQWLLLNIAASGAAGGKLELGSEFQGFGVTDFIFAAPGITLALLAATAGAVWLRCATGSGRLLPVFSVGCDVGNVKSNDGTGSKQPLPVAHITHATPGESRCSALSATACTALVIAWVWTGGLLVFSRLIEYAAPLTVLALGLVVRDIVNQALTVPVRSLPRPARLKFIGGLAMLALFFCGAQYWSQLQLRAIQRSTLSFFPRANATESVAAWQRNRYFDGAAAWLRQNATPKTVVLNFHWDDFPELFYGAPEFYYSVGLDPTLLKLQHPEKSALLEGMRTQQQPLDFAALHEAFGAEYLIMRNYRAAKFESLRTGQLKPVFMDDGALIYRLD